MPKIALGQHNTPLDWTALQAQAWRVLGRSIVVPRVENDWIGERLSRLELAALGFKVAADPQLAPRYLGGQTLTSGMLR